MIQTLAKRAAMLSIAAMCMPSTAADFYESPAMQPNDYVETGEAWQEQDLPLPGLPGDDDLLQIDVTSASRNEEFIDRETLMVGKDGITRVTLVTRHRSGSQSVTREGIRCTTGEYRIYGIANGSEWSVPKVSEWRPIPLSGYKTLRSVLYESILCTDGFPKKPEKAIKDVLYPPDQKNW